MRIHPGVAKARRSIGLVLPSSPAPASSERIKRQSVVVEVLWHKHELGMGLDAEFSHVLADILDVAGHAHADREVYGLPDDEGGYERERQDRRHAQ